MKRSSHLIERIIEPDNLRLAFYKAKKGKALSTAVAHYRKSLDDRLLDLRAQVDSGQVQVGNYRYFKVYDPKERNICASAFSEQVLHHALMNVCHPHFERQQIFDSYASRPGKGVHAALHRAAQFNRFPDHWFLKLDMRKFFDSLHHRVLKTQLHRLFKEERLLSIFGQIIDSYEVLPERGVPIGNLTSQYFANHYLSGLDHFVKETLGCKAYVRYMDDLVLWHPDKHWLKAAEQQINAYTQEKLRLQLKPTLLNACSRGLPFCGYKLQNHHLLLSQRSKKRYIRKMRNLKEAYLEGLIDESTYQRRTLPLIAFTEFADARVLRRKVLTSIGDPCTYDEV